MIQGLAEPVRAILDTLRDVTGRDVLFVRKPDLKSLARIRMAGGASAAHVLFYRDEHDPLINHVIANECGHLIRLFGAPAGKASRGRGQRADPGALPRRDPGRHPEALAHPRARYAEYLHPAVV